MNYNNYCKSSEFTAYNSAVYTDFSALGSALSTGKRHGTYNCRDTGLCMGLIWMDYLNIWHCNSSFSVCYWECIHLKIGNSEGRSIALYSVMVREENVSCRIWSVLCCRLSCRSVKGQIPNVTDRGTVDVRTRYSSLGNTVSSTDSSTWRRVSMNLCPVPMSCALVRPSSDPWFVNGLVRWIVWA